MKEATECLKAWNPHRGTPSVSKTGQSRCSTTLFDDGGLPFRVTKRKPSLFGFLFALNSDRTVESAGGSVIGAALPLLLVDCTLPHQADRRM